ncbi:MAG: tRNA (adenine-N1)-methyltransferase [Candidatus Methanofastidiosia archaeon]|jgi:tRNA (adenine57-N1/adenine58-N1)-methyltransferase
MTIIKEGDLVLLLHKKKSFLVSATDREFHTHFGVIDLSRIVGEEYGITVSSHDGHEFAVINPTFIDFIKKMRKMPQVIQPKDAAQIVAYTGVSSGDTVVEAGAGSGALTIFLAYTVAPGMVYSYEKRQDFLEVAQQNIERFNIKNVKFKLQDVYEGIDEKNVDLVTLDIASPEKMVNPGFNALKPGGFLYSYSPCVEQVARFCLAAKDMGMEVKTIECIVREYQVNKKGTRPKSRMLGHTGYMSFARKV